jgi:hypothetical protein
MSRLDGIASYDLYFDSFFTFFGFPQLLPGPKITVKQFTHADARRYKFKNFPYTKKTNNDITDVCGYNQ